MASQAGQNIVVDAERTSEFEVLYDTGKMGTPEHVEKVARQVEKIIGQYPHLTAGEALMLNIQRGKASTKTSNSSGGGSYPAYCKKIGVQY